MAEYKGVMVYAEASQDKLSAITRELMGCARKLADDLGEGLSAVLVGSDITSLAQEAITLQVSADGYEPREVVVTTGGPDATIAVLRESGEMLPIIEGETVSPFAK